MNSNMDSFDVRIDDDLFEVIVTYLPIEDKLRYESVSKRFQRFVFNKQKILRISDSKDSADNLNEDYLVGEHDMNVTILSKLLNKFRFITTLEICSLLFNMTEVLDTITENSNHLTAIHTDFYLVEPQTMEKFCRKFGENLKNIWFRGYTEPEMVEFVLKSSPNLSSVSRIFGDVLNAKVWPKNVVKINGLFVDSQKELQSLSRPELLHLKYLDIKLISVFEANDNKFKSFSYFKDLKVLKIDNFTEENESIIWSKNLESIATNCRHLEYLSLEYSGKFNSKKCFQSFIHFSGLKKLCFKVYPENNSKEEFDEQITDLSPLKNCKNLLVLNLRLKAINSNVFNGIDLVIPQLKQLSFEFGLKITDEVLESMTNLKNLKQIEITTDYLDITSKGLRVVTNGCKRLKSFIIYDDILVNDKNERNKLEELYII